MVKSLTLLISVLLVQGAAFGQDPSQIVEKMVYNELSAAKNDQSHWMYRDTDSEKGTTKVEEVIQTREGWMHRLISINGNPPSPAQEKKNQDEIKKFQNDPAYRKQQRDKL